MKHFLGFALLTTFLVCNALIAFYAPPHVRLLVLPIFSLVFLIAIAGVFRRKEGGGSPPS